MTCLCITRVLFCLLFLSVQGQLQYPSRLPSSCTNIQQFFNTANQDCSPCVVGNSPDPASQVQRADSKFDSSSVLLWLVQRLSLIGNMGLCFSVALTSVFFQFCRAHAPQDTGASHLPPHGPLIACCAR